MSLVAAIAMLGFGAFTLYNAFVAHLDAQSGIVFVFLPLYQLLGLVPFVIVVRLLERRGAK